MDFAGKLQRFSAMKLMGAKRGILASGGRDGFVRFRTGRLRPRFAMRASRAKSWHGVTADVERVPQAFAYSGQAFQALGAGHL